MIQFAALTKSLWRRWMRWIPIRILSSKHRPRISAHLKSLSPQDRYLRFGYSATDEQIENYVAKLEFGRDDIYGVFNRRLEIMAMAHVAFSADPQWATCAEFGVSVDLKLRGRGLGARLFERAVVHARNEGVALLFNLDRDTFEFLLFLELGGAFFAQCCTQLVGGWAFEGCRAFALKAGLNLAAADV